MLPELYKIIWRDTLDTGGWLKKEEITESILDITSVGFLIKDYGMSILITSHIGQEWVHATMQIPKESIKSMEQIKWQS